MQKITPHLWFDTQAKEAAEFYVSLFGKDSRVKSIFTIPDTPSGSVDVVTFSLWGHEFTAISAGPFFKFNPSVSFSVACRTKEEVDTLWEKFSVHGNVLMELGQYPFSERYGWLSDKYGLSWQVIAMGDNTITQNITPSIMYVGDVCGKAEEAINFYVSIFRDAPSGSGKGKSEVGDISRYTKGQEPDKEGTITHVFFTLMGQVFAAMDSARAHQFSFNEAISFVVNCKTQEEIDYYWSKLSADPKAEQCGWLKDKYGLSWQIVPIGLNDMLESKDKEKVARVTQAFLKMKKFNLAELKLAARGN